MKVALLFSLLLTQEVLATTIFCSGNTVSNPEAIIIPASAELEITFNKESMTATLVGNFIDSGRGIHSDFADTQTALQKNLPIKKWDELTIYAKRAKRFSPLNCGEGRGPCRNFEELTYNKLTNTITLRESYYFAQIFGKEYIQFDFKIRCQP